MQLTVERVRTLKGAPLSVLVLLMLERSALSQGFLARHSGYSDKAVAAALDLLADYGLARRIERYTWALAAGAEQLPFIVDADLPASTPTVGQAPADAEPGRKNSDLRSENFRPEPPLVVSLIDSDSIESEESNQLERRSEKIRANSETLAEFGIMEPARSRLANLAHVDPRQIRYHCQTCESTGQAIHRIEHNWRVPVTFERDERNRLFDGAYADLINRGD